jgi:carbohydrate kinase (thermoresistant glucokinase family)
MQSPVIYIMGVSGSGKTTIGKLLSAATGIPFFDADDLHSPANKEKMKAGIPLNDEDRQSWLQQLNQLALKQQRSAGAIIACSALKEKYRNILKEGICISHWIFLHGSFELIYERMKRRDHFMPPDMLSSQFEILEIPADALSIDITNSPREIVNIIRKNLKI